MRKLVVLVLTAAVLFLSASSALADAPAFDESPGCGGLIIATFNHNSGQFGASGNPKASSGPGYALKQGTAGGIQGAREALCP